MKKMFLAFIVIFVLFGLNSCEQPSDDDDDDTGIWDKTVTATTHTLGVSDGKLDMSITQAEVGGLINLSQNGPHDGDFSMTLTFTDFSTDDAGTYFALASVGFACSIGVLSGSQVQVSVRTHLGSYKIADVSTDSGTFSISRTGNDVTCTYEVGLTTAAITEAYTGDLGAGLKLHNNSGSVTTGTLEVKLDDFTVTGGGGAVQSDDFTQDRIK